MVNGTDVSFGELLESVGARTPAPGGGAVASWSGALAAALARMVANYSLGRKTLADHQQRLEGLVLELARVERIFLELAVEDQRAYLAMSELLRLPDTDERRCEELPAVAAIATQVPMTLIATCTELLRTLDELAAKSNPHLRSDLAIAATLAEAAARASRWLVVVNLTTLSEFEETGDILPEVDGMLDRAGALLGAIEAQCTRPV